MLEVSLWVCDLGFEGGGFPLEVVAFFCIRGNRFCEIHRVGFKKCSWIEPAYFATFKKPFSGWNKGVHIESFALKWCWHHLKSALLLGSLCGFENIKPEHWTASLNVTVTLVSRCQHYSGHMGCQYLRFYLWSAHSLQWSVTDATRSKA